MLQPNAQIPLSYAYGPTVGEHFQKAMSIADAMDQMRSRRVRDAQVQQEMQKTEYALQLEREKQAREASIRGKYAKQLEGVESFEAETPAPAEPGPLPPPVSVQPRGVETARSIYDQIASQGQADPATYSTMSRAYTDKGLTIPPEVIDKIASGAMTYEQFLADDKTPGLTAWDKASVKEQEAAQLAADAENQRRAAEVSAQTAAQQAAYVQEAGAYDKKGIPEAYQWMGREGYKTYLGLAKDDPEFAEKYVDRLLERVGKMKKEESDYGKTPTGLDLKFAGNKEYVAEQMAVLDKYYENGLITKEGYEALKSAVPTRPVSWLSDIDFYSTSKRKKEAAEQAQKYTDVKAKEGAIKTAERKEAKEIVKEEEAKINAEMLLNNTNKNIDYLTKQIDTKFAATGVVSNLAAKWTSSEAATRKSYFEQLKSNLTVKRLTDLKAAGGTLGALSDKERVLLETAASRLDFGGSEKRNRDALLEIKGILNAARDRAKQAKSDAELIDRYKK